MRRYRYFSDRTNGIMSKIDRKQAVCRLRDEIEGDRNPAKKGQVLRIDYDDREEFLEGLKLIIDAMGGSQALSGKIGLSPSHLHQSLSLHQGNPRLSTVLAILEACGFGLSVWNARPAYHKKATKSAPPQQPDLFNPEPVTKSVEEPNPISPNADAVRQLLETWARMALGNQRKSI